LLRLLYRDLKNNLDDERDYITAGDFYFGEMNAFAECGKEDKKLRSWWGKRAVYFMYWLAAGYGERPLRSILFFLCRLGILAASFRYECFTLEGKTIWPSWFDAAEHGLRALTLNRNYYIEPKCFWGRWYTLAANIVGPVQIALIAIALRRRFRR
jgi:hypothetical protein